MHTAGMNKCDAWFRKNSSFLTTGSPFLKKKKPTTGTPYKCHRLTCSSQPSQTPVPTGSCSKEFSEPQSPGVSNPLDQISPVRHLGSMYYRSSQPSSWSERWKHVLKCPAQGCVYLKSCLLTLDKRWGKTQGHLGGGGNCREAAVADNTISGFPVLSIHIQCSVIGLDTELILGSCLWSQHRLLQKGKSMTMKLNTLWELGRTGIYICSINKNQVVQILL